MYVYVFNSRHGHWLKSKAAGTLEPALSGLYFRQPMGSITPTLKRW